MPGICARVIPNVHEDKLVAKTSCESGETRAVLFDKVMANTNLPQDPSRRS
jgi:hypothetical protein